MGNKPWTSIISEFIFTTLILLMPYLPCPLWLAGSYEHTFELYSEEGRVYLFGSDDGSIVKNWIQAIAMVINLFIYLFIF